VNLALISSFGRRSQLAESAGPCDSQYRTSVQRAMQFRASGTYEEAAVAGERSARCDHLYLTRRCTGRNGGRDQAGRHHGKGGRYSVKGHTGGARKIRAQDLDGRSHLARDGRSLTNGLSPVDRLKTVPQPVEPQLLLVLPPI
jgi:hypothetical protein